MEFIIIQKCMTASNTEIIMPIFFSVNYSFNYHTQPVSVGRSAQNFKAIYRAASNRMRMCAFSHLLNVAVCAFLRCLFRDFRVLF